MDNWSAVEVVSFALLITFASIAMLSWLVQFHDTFKVRRSTKNERQH